MEIALGAFSKTTNDAVRMATAAMQEMKDVVQAANTARQETKDNFEKIQTFLFHATKHTLTKSERLEHILGNAEDGTGGVAGTTTVMGRIEQLERAILELAETVGDPDAARATVVRHEVAINTSPILRPTADIGVDAVDLITFVEHTDAGVQSELPQMVEAEVETQLEDLRQETPASYGLSTGSRTIFASSPEPPRGPSSLRNLASASHS